MIGLVSTATLDLVVDRLRRAAPEATIILFGSRARGDSHAGSDVDILVVEPSLVSRHDEIVRLSDRLADLDVEVDLLVASRATFEKWSGEPCSVMHHAARDGRVLHAPA